MPVGEGGGGSTGLGIIPKKNSFCYCVPYIHIVIEVTRNMAELLVVGSQRPVQPKNVNI